MEIRPLAPHFLTGLERPAANSGFANVGSTRYAITILAATPVNSFIFLTVYNNYAHL